MAIEITTTASEITDATSTNFAIRNQGPATVYLGDDTVTADQSGTGGYPLHAGESVQWISHKTVEETIYAVTAEGSAYLSVIGL